MIAVLPEESERDIVREFFELFKTPWELHQAECTYDVAVLPADRAANIETNAKLVILYGSTRAECDERTRIPSSEIEDGSWIRFPPGRIPLIGKCLTFDVDGIGLVDESRGRPVAHAMLREGTVWVRLGFDLFREIKVLLSIGQPASSAAIPTLERYISLLRSLIVGCGLPLVEVPPVPEGFNFLACLTHDVDHPAIRRHKLDRTVLGFCYRALVGTGLNVLRGRATMREWARNVFATIKTPFVFLGLASDFWNTFSNYLNLEKDLGATYFFIPERNSPGLAFNGKIIAERRSAYEASDVSEEIIHLRVNGCEIGVHGIDAWSDSARGREERHRVSSVVGASPAGLRMHWLCFTSESPNAIEAAGFAYDSSWGYNEVVGYRAGTGQVFKPPGARSLLELPLIIMDTALFFPVQMNLSSSSAKPVVLKLIEEAVKSGGALTINWHDRSIAPERLWDDFYIWLIRQLKQRGAWFPTAAAAVSWFRKRRTARFEQVSWNEHSLSARIQLPDSGECSPPLILRVHCPSRQRVDRNWTWTSLTGHIDIGFNGAANFQVELPMPGIRATLVQT